MILNVMIGRMLTRTKQLMEYRNGNVAIHPRFNKLITALRTAVENGGGMLGESKVADMAETNLTGNGLMGTKAEDE